MNEQHVHPKLGGRTATQYRRGKRLRKLPANFAIEKKLPVAAGKVTFIDWFHVTMRITTIKQMAKGLPTEPLLPDILSEMDSVKWYLWHGNVIDALRRLEPLSFDLEGYEGDETLPVQKAWQAIHDFQHYITVNEPFIPNYSERYRYGERNSTAFVETAVNEVISKRMVKKQQMHWTKRGAHLLLQVRMQTLNDDLRDVFCRWCPDMATTDPEAEVLPLAV